MKSGNLKASVWTHFEQVWEGETRYAKCKHCDNKFEHKLNSRTGTLTRHLSKVHGDIGGIFGGQTQLTSVGSSDGSSIFQFNPKTARQSLINWIMITKKPFRQAKDEHLERFIQEHLNPAYKNTSRQAAKRENFKLYEAKRSDLQAYFSTIDHCLSFTYDT